MRLVTYELILHSFGTLREPVQLDGLLHRAASLGAGRRSPEKRAERTATSGVGSRTSLTSTGTQVTTSKRHSYGGHSEAAHMCLSRTGGSGRLEEEKKA